MATPAATDVDDESLMFLTHAPGAIVPPRPKETDVNESLAGKILGKFGIRPGGRGPKNDESEEGKTLTGRLAEGAGRGAFDRALKASRRSQKKADERPSWADQHVKATPAGGGVVTAPAVAPEASSEPSFLGLLPGALFTPLRGTPVTVVHVVMFSLAILLIELSAFLGIVACLIVSAELISLRVRLIRDACAGRSKVAWPDVGALVSAVPPFVAATFVLLPALILTAVAFMPVSFDGSNPASISARGGRLLDPIPEPEGDAQAPEVPLGQTTLLMLEASIGQVGHGGVGALTRPPADVAKSVADSARARVTTLVDFGGASGAGIAARVLGLLGLIYFPMGLLCAVRLRSAYAALHLPLILRSIIRCLGSYLVALIVLGVMGVATLCALFLLPERVVGMGAAGHVLWAGAVAVTLVAFPMISSDLMGKLYRARQFSLGWD